MKEAEATMVPAAVDGSRGRPKSKAGGSVETVSERNLTATRTALLARHTLNEHI